MLSQLLDCPTRKILFKNVLLETNFDESFLSSKNLINLILNFGVRVLRLAQWRVGGNRQVDGFETPVYFVIDIFCLNY